MALSGDHQDIFLWEAKLASGRSAYVIGYRAGITQIAPTLHYRFPACLIVLSGEDYTGEPNVALRLHRASDPADKNDYASAIVSRRSICYLGTKAAWRLERLHEFYRLYIFALARFCPCHHVNWRAMFLKDKRRDLAYRVYSRRIPRVVLQESFIIQLQVGEQVVEIQRIERIDVKPSPISPVVDDHHDLQEHPAAEHVPTEAHKFDLDPAEPDYGDIPSPGEWGNGMGFSGELGGGYAPSYYMLPYPAIPAPQIAEETLTKQEPPASPGMQTPPSVSAQQQPALLAQWGNYHEAMIPLAAPDPILAPHCYRPAPFSVQQQPYYYHQTGRDPPSGQALYPSHYQQGQPSHFGFMPSHHQGYPGHYGRVQPSRSAPSTVHPHM